MMSGVNDIAGLETKRQALLADLERVEAELRAAQPDFNDPRIGTGTRTSTFDPAFGYLSKSAGCYADTDNTLPLDGAAGPPSSFFDLAGRNFARELRELGRAISAVAEDPESCEAELEVAGAGVEVSATVEEAAEAAELRRKLGELTLSNEAIWAREEARPQVVAPLILKAPYYVLCFALDTFFDGRPISRFWFLETVARIPYFSYISMLHLYESLGWWRRSAETKQVHFAEEWNEFHHLLIMESLGGDQRWLDRFLAQHSAVLYYWVLIVTWLVSPSLAYSFSELIEAHAVDTYAEFVEANEAQLRTLPAPRIAKAYYEAADLHYFDEFQTSRPRGSRRPQVDSLFDVFCQIRDDEAEHVATMSACQDRNVLVRAPRTESAVALAASAALILQRVAPLVEVEGGVEELIESASGAIGLGLLGEFGSSLDALDPELIPAIFGGAWLNALLDAIDAILALFKGL